MTTDEQLVASAELRARVISILNGNAGYHGLDAVASLYGTPIALGTLHGILWNLAEKGVIRRRKDPYTGMMVYASNQPINDERAVAPPPAAMHDLSKIAELDGLKVQEMRELYYVLRDIAKILKW